MQPVLLVVQFIIAVALVAIILLQRTSQDGGGLMGGGSTMGGLFTARGSANLLTKTTAILATLFIVNSLALGYLAGRQHQEQANSVADQMPAAPSPTRDASPALPPNDKAQVPKPAPAAPAVPQPPQVPMAH